MDGSTGRNREREREENLVLPARSLWENPPIGEPRSKGLGSVIGSTRSAASSKEAHGDPSRRDVALPADDDQQRRPFRNGFPRLQKCVLARPVSPGTRSAVRSYGVSSLHARTHARTHAVRRAARTRLSFDARPLSR